MKEQFRTLEKLKANEEMKQNVFERIEKIEMKKQNKQMRVLKPALIVFLLVGIISIPALQEKIDDTISVKAQEVEVINQKIAKANDKLSAKEINYQEYHQLVDTLVQERGQLVKEIKSEDPAFKITLVEELDENGESIDHYIIEDVK